MMDQQKRKPPEQKPLTGKDYERQQRNLQELKKIMNMNNGALV